MIEKWQDAMVSITGGYDDIRCHVAKICHDLLPVVVLGAV
jgi:hypothetical protein